MLSTPAFNALLKILEEPPEHLVFILATTELHKVCLLYTSRLQLRLSDSYLSGFSLGTPVKTLIAQIQAVNPDAAVTVTDGSGKAVSDSAVVSTGQLLTIQDAAGTYIYTCVVYGDINGDGHIGAADLLYVERHILGKLTLTGAAARAAMISSNHIGAASLLRIERHILGTNSIMQK